MEKGKTNNPNGRPKGTPNKITSGLKARIQQLIDGNWKIFEKNLKTLEPKDQMLIMEKLISFVVPKRQSISIEEEVNAEYAALEKFLKNAPGEVVDAIFNRIVALKEKKGE